MKDKLHFSDQGLLSAVADLLTFHRIVTITGSLKGVSPDPGDDKVVECAVAAGATHVITGDARHLLPLRMYKSISIMSPAEFLRSVLPKAK